ncbi:MAG TPA: hypothetical protein VIK93_10545 [Limnochordales bacterium]
MRIEYVPQLRLLQELYQQPRGMDRFYWYLQQMLGEDDDGELDVVVPMTGANPMGREHCLEAVNALLAIDADRVAQEAAAEALPHFADVDVTVRLSVTLLDDLKGGWTNRYLTEAGMRMCTDPRLERGAIRRRQFVVVPCWTSETYTPDRVRALTRACLYRFAHLYQHGLPRTLRDIMTLDGKARAFAGERPTLSEEELEYTAHVLAPHMDSESFPIQFACLYGDEAARQVGYAPQGLSAYAGWELALDMALKRQSTASAPTWP